MKTRSLYVYSGLNYENKVSICLQWFELGKQGQYMFTVVSITQKSFSVIVMFAVMFTVVIFGQI